MSTDEIPGWALEAAEHLVSALDGPTPGTINHGNMTRTFAAIIARHAPQPSAEVANETGGTASAFDEVWAEEPELRVRFTDLGNSNVRISIGDLGEVSMRREATVASWRFNRLVAKMRPITGEVMETQRKLAACQQERDRLREAGNRLAEALIECLDPTHVLTGRDISLIESALAHWRATTEETK